jgi:hypothetical protein
MDDNLDMTWEQYIQALKRFKEAIEHGRMFDAFDCTEIGYKDTQCSWGLCDRSEEMWPPETRFDRYAEPVNGFVNHKYLGRGQHCPIDKDQSLNTLSMGCFYRCRVFQSKEKKISREEAIKLYEISLNRLGVKS